MKTAGTSIEAYLSNLCGDNDIVTPIFPPSKLLKPRNYGGLPLTDVAALTPTEFTNIVQTHIYRNHLGSGEIRDRVGEDIWSEYFKFCVERNPWDKTVSQYYMWKNRLPGQISFEDFLALNKLPVDHTKWYDRKNDDYIVDEIIRYENLTAELGAVFERLNIPFSDGLTTKEKTDYRKVKRPYETYYNKESKAIVDRAFKFEIDTLNYKFTRG